MVKSKKGGHKSGPKSAPRPRPVMGGGSLNPNDMVGQAQREGVGFDGKKIPRVW